MGVTGGVGERERGRSRRAQQSSVSASQPCRPPLHLPRLPPFPPLLPSVRPPPLHPHPHFHSDARVVACAAVLCLCEAAQLHVRLPPSLPPHTPLGWSRVQLPFMTSLSNSSIASGARSYPRVDGLPSPLPPILSFSPSPVWRDEVCASIHLRLRLSLPLRCGVGDPSGGAFLPCAPSAAFTSPDWLLLHCSRLARQPPSRLRRAPPSAHLCAR